MVTRPLSYRVLLDALEHIAAMLQRVLQQPRIPKSVRAELQTLLDAEVLPMLRRNRRGS